MYQMGVSFYENPLGLARGLSHMIHDSIVITSSVFSVTPVYADTYNAE